MAITRTAKGTALSTSNTMTISSFSIAAGASLLVGIVYRDQNLRPSSVVWNGINLTEDGRSYNPGSSAGNGHLCALWSAHGLSSGSSSCVITWTGSTPGHQACFATEVTGITRRDRVTEDIEDSTTNPKAPTTEMIRKDESILFGIFESAGPVSDAAGTPQNGYSSGQRTGTASGSPPGVITVHETFKITSTAEATQAEKTGATSRDWAVLCVTYRNFTTVVTTDLTIIDEANATTNWTMLSGSPVLNTANQLEGSGCIETKWTPGTVQGMMHTISSVNLTDKNVYWWLSFDDAPGVERLAKKSGGGIFIQVQSGSNNWSRYYVGGRDTLGSDPSWTRYAAQLANTPDLVGSNGACNLAAVTSAGIGGLLEQVPPTGDFYGRVDIGHYGTGEMSVSEGDAEEPASTDALIAFDEDGFWGLISKDVETNIVKLLAKITIGSLTAGVNTDWAEIGSVIVFLDKAFGDDYYEIKGQSGTGTTKIRFGNKIGGAVLNGCYITSITDEYKLTFIDPDLNEAQFYGTTFVNPGAVSLPPTATGREMDGCQIVTGDEIVPGTCPIENSIITESDTSGILITSINHNFKDSRVLGCPDGIRFSTVGAFSLDNIIFSGNTYDIWYSGNSATITAGSFVVGQGYKILTVGTTDFTAIGSADNVIGTKFVATGVGTGTGTATQVLVINSLNGANPGTYRATGTNGDVMIVNAVPITVEVLDDTDGIGINLAHVLLLLESDHATVVLSGATNTSGIITTTLSYPGSPVSLVGWARQWDLAGDDYVAKDIGGTVTPAGLYLLVRLKPI